MRQTPVSPVYVQYVGAHCIRSRPDGMHTARAYSTHKRDQCPRLGVLGWSVRSDEFGERNLDEFKEICESVNNIFHLGTVKSGFSYQPNAATGNGCASAPDRSMDPEFGTPDDISAVLHTYVRTGTMHVSYWKHASDRPPRDIC